LIGLVYAGTNTVLSFVRLSLALPGHHQHNTETLVDPNRLSQTLGLRGRHCFHQQSGPYWGLH
jgi:hypothetical protein